jgi:chemotaxis protein methyltransferase CheR
MYFRPERFMQVISRLGRCLATDGFLAVSPAEASWQLLEQFRPVQLGGAVLYQRRPAGSLPPSLPSEPAAPERQQSAGPSVRNTQGQACAVQALPSNQELNWKRALNHARLGQHEQAEAALVLLLKQAPTCAPALTLQAQLLVNQGRLAEALVACDYALALERLSAAAHQLRASILEQLGRAEEAVQSLQRSLYLDPNYVLSHYTLGRIALRGGQVGYARKCFSDVLALLRCRPAEQELQVAHGLTCAGLARATQNLLAQLG